MSYKLRVLTCSPEFAWAHEWDWMESTGNPPRACSEHYAARMAKLAHGRYVAEKGNRKIYRRNYWLNERHTRTTLVRNMFNSAKSRSRRFNVPFALTREDIDNIWRDSCEVCDVNFEPGDGGATDASRTLDRVNPQVGYISTNIAMLCHRCNTVKSFGSAEEHFRIAAWIQQRESVTRF